MLLVLLGVAAVALVRRRRRPDDAVDVWFDDGSIVSLPLSSPAGARLADLAANVLASAR